MIGNFLASKFSGYLAIGLIIIIIAFGAYMKYQGKLSCLTKVNEEKTETINENIKIIDKALAHDNRSNDAYIRWLQSQQN